jgi:two-component system, response regulator PdtaR
MAGYSVVVADDEPHVLNTLSQLIEFAGHRVVGKASDGDEAISLNQTMCPDVVVLDLVMPGMTGLDTAKQMMVTRPVAIVACTAHYDDDLVNSASSTGIYGYVVKPCSQAALVSAIQVAVSRFRDSRVLRVEVDALKEALASKKVVEQAKSIVMQTRQLSEDEAHKFLQQESQRQSRSLTELAEAVISAERALFPKACSTLQSH